MNTTTRIRIGTIAGLGLAVLAAVLIVVDVLSVAWGSALGMVGVGIIAGARTTT